MSGSIVWLASYPKSGNTWLRAMLTALTDPNHQLANLDAMVGGSEFGERQFLDDLCGIDSSNLTYEQLKPYLRIMRQSAGDLFESPYFVKTHDQFGLTADGHSLFPAESAKLAILIVRDPRDIAVSLAAHNRTDIETAITCMADSGYGLNLAAHEGGEFLPVHIGDWNRHYRSWLDQGEIPVLLLRYEDMATDPLTALRKVAESVGISKQDADLQAAISAASFERLREAEKTSGFAEKPAGVPDFFRSGRAGGWQRVLNANQVKTIETHFVIDMHRLGYRNGGD